MKRKAIKGIMLFLTVVCSLNGYSGDNSPADSIISQWISQDILRNASIGIYLQDARNGEILGTCNPQLSLVPASTLKLLTTATALEIMGPDYRFSTRLAFSGTIRNDTLAGDLIILGGGDPALGSKYFREHYLKNHFLNDWIDSLHLYNIRHISGNMITDATIYDDQPVPSTWIWEDIGNYYGAGANGLSVYDNTYEIHLWSPPVSGQPTRIVSVDPVIPGIAFDNRVLSSNDQRDLAYVFGSPPDSRRVMRGSIPRGRKDFVIRASVPNPPQLLARQFKDMLEADGITVGGGIKEQTMKPYILVNLATTVSPPLIDLIRVTNHESVNLFAEHLLKHLAYLETGLGTTEEGIRIVTGFWKNQGIDTRGLFICDGSGLSRFNALTSEQMVRILAYMKNNSRYGDLFFSSLPAVPEGTLYYFNPLNFPNQSLRAKSGSMTRVRCYAGLLKTRSDRQILFAVFLNNFSCSQSQATDAIENLLISLHGL